jgi:hypothetical protein
MKMLGRIIWQNGWAELQMFYQKNFANVNGV